MPTFLANNEKCDLIHEILLDSGTCRAYLLPPTIKRNYFPMATTEVILRDKITNLGAEADVVTVKAGFARNYLIPEGKAYEATKANLKHLDQLKVQRAKREAEEHQQAQELAAKIKKLKLEFTLETGQGGKAFGSVTTIDIQKKLSDKGIEIDRHTIQLSSPIKTSGKQDLEIKLHTEITANLKINVKTDGEEANAASAE
ncbi:MAG: 50S ribosomal protein L9 [Akkermansiaceae bacterium]|nr:50S ribosomal protein L9 [Akkermansiaceae bacterium]